MHKAQTRRVRHHAPIHRRVWARVYSIYASYQIACHLIDFDTRYKHSDMSCQTKRPKLEDDKTYIDSHEREKLPELMLGIDTAKKTKTI